ncbi:GspH/FimT family pseudopilin [Xanthomonas sp.]|uniref:GspH/FimT family pseudopilin n=1 Tax=Xanthomonas sp. TaxID=29446 RepID=UPI0031BAC3FF
MRTRQRGLSLIEAIACMVVIAILTAIALPGTRHTLQRQRIATSMHLLSGGLAAARNAAITGAVPVTVCPSAGDGRCRSDLDWSEGWLIYRDSARQPQPRSPADVLRNEIQPVSSSISLLSSSGRPTVRFLADGRAAGSNITVRVCADGKLQGEVIVNNLGRVRSRRTPGTQSCD